MVLGLLGVASIVGLKSMTDGGSTISATVSTTAGSTIPAGGTRTTVGGVGTGITAAAARSACTAAAGAAGSASNVYYVNSGGSYPTKWSDLTASTPPVFALAANDRVNPADPAELDGVGWKLTMSGGGTTAPAFTCG